VALLAPRLLVRFLFVCSFAQRTRRKIATKKFIDWQYPTLALSSAYLSTPSTPSVPRPYPHESRSRTSTSGTAGYCGVLTATRTDLEHRQPSLGRALRVRRERAVEVALDRLDVLQKVSAACCNAERALQHRPCRQYHPDARCALDETLRDAATRLASRQEGD
jgi:hypothetical protein